MLLSENNFTLLFIIYKNNNLTSLTTLLQVFVANVGLGVSVNVQAVREPSACIHRWVRVVTSMARVYGLSYKVCIWLGSTVAVNKKDRYVQRLKNQHFYSFKLFYILFLLWHFQYFNWTDSCFPSLDLRSGIFCID